MKTHRLLLLLAGAGAGLVTGVCADPVVELPSYVVTGSRVLPPPEAWRYASAPGFEFLSNLSASETQDRIRDFILFHRAVDLVWPLIRINAQAPAAVVFCAGQERFAEFAPVNAPADLSGTVSMALQNHEQAAIVVNVAAAESGAGDGASMARFANRIIRGEYVHFLFSRIEPVPPRWLAQGLTRLFLTMDYGAEQIGFSGSADPMDFAARQALAARIKAAPDRPLSAWANDPALVLGRQQGALLPFDAFFRAGPEGSADADSAGTVWDRQCYEFVHLCLFGANGRYRKGLAELALAAMRGPVTPAGFQQCFQLSYEDMQTALWADTDFAGGVGLRFPAPAGGASSGTAPVALRAATDAEVGRIEGDALRLGGRIEAAHLALIAPYLRGARDPQLLAALGQEEAAAGHDERARRFLEAAVAAHTTRARAYAELARLRLAAAPRTPAGANGKLAPAQWAPIIDLLTAALRLRPPLRETYELMAQGWDESAVTPTRDQLTPVTEGVELFSDDLELVYRAAVLFEHTGYPGSARQLADFGAGRATDASTRERFRALRAALAVPAQPPGP